MRSADLAQRQPEVEESRRGRRFGALASRTAAVLVPTALCVVFAGAGLTAAAHRDPASPPGGTPSATPTRGLLPAANPADPARVMFVGQDVPDPRLLAVGGTYYLYSSSIALSPVWTPAVRRSTDLLHWSAPTPVFAQAPSWSVGFEFMWGPEVVHIRRHYVMWFSAGVKGISPMLHCIGVATSSSPVGPFVSRPRPSVCQFALHGDIDPFILRDPQGRLWLYWKSDDNQDPSAPEPTSIFVQRLAPDAATLLGQPKRILQASFPWEARRIEAPGMVMGDGAYWLFYTGGWPGGTYALGLARCRTPRGPCTPTSDRPWLGADAQASAPSEGSVLQHAGKTWLVYSPVAYWHLGHPVKRPVAIAQVAFGPKGPYLARW